MGALEPLRSVISFAGGATARRLAFAATLAVMAGACSTGATVTPGSSSLPGTGGASPLVGAWVTTVTREDLTAAGITDPGALNENSGRFTTTYGADGTWTSVQESIDGAPINSPVFRGTYTIDGSSLVMKTEFPAQYQDAGLHYTWTLDGTALRLDLLDPPDALLPVIVEAHPWTRAT